ncbi:FtsW/RodA/SpoVE family cell cycle protein [Saccharibacillus kuerlensis]|uniref:Cell division protein FtsW n=1 Tax=Saccharibacillus kuerlensis TaxID=459527 RepID=A0ABQ2L2Z0_9BACL|nr:FtsW/RodA/SpoVE family cell cycle protein [Saccharibacillus kuerlensis]GGO00467.1 cell division protein FtsW [Saccharibacillus kuerlensis]
MSSDHTKAHNESSKVSSAGKGFEFEADVQSQERPDADLLVDAYLDRMCARIKAKELHPELREEMRAHIDELAAGREDSGASPLEAASWALAQMGDADEVGGTLGQVHRPKFNWKLLVPLTAIVAIGLLALFSLAASGDGIFQFINFGEQQSVYYGMGIAALILFTFFDYRLLKKHAVWLYTITILLTILFFTFGSTMINGTLGWVNIGGITLNWTLCMFILFLLALPGLFERLTLKDEKWNSGRQWVAIALILLPVALYIYFSLLAWLLLSLYLIASLLLFSRAGGSRIYLYALPAAAAASAVSLYLRNEYWQDRIMAVFAPHPLTPDANYANTTMAAAIREGGWLGQGFGSSGQSITYPYADAIFPYLTYSFGWIAAGILVVCIVWLVVLLLGAVRAITDYYGRSLAAGLSILLAGQWIYGIGASLGLLPFTKIAMPFIGYGGSTAIINCAIFGLILGIYRRKDIIWVHRAAAGTQSTRSL